MNYSEVKTGLPIANGIYTPEDVICYKHLKDFKDVRGDIGKSLKEICYDCPSIDSLRGQPSTRPIWENDVDSLHFNCEHAERNRDLSVTCNLLSQDTQSQVACVLSIAERPTEKPTSSYSRHFAVQDKKEKTIRCFIMPS